MEKSQEMPHYMVCSNQKNNLLDFQNQRYSYIGIFRSLREREREGGGGGEREGESEKEREKEKREEKEGRERGREGERERTKVRAIIFLNRPG